MLNSIDLYTYLGQNSLIEVSSLFQEPASQRDVQPLGDLLGGRVRRLLQDQQHGGVCRDLGEDEVQQVGFYKKQTLKTSSS